MLKPYPKYKPARRSFSEGGDSGVEWIGQVPESWTIKPIKRLFRIVNGATPTSTVPEYWDGNIPWVTPDDLGSNSSVIINDTRRQITEQGYNSCGTTLIPEGSLVMSTRAPIGYLAIAGKPMCSNQGCKSLVALNNMHNKFYYYFLSASKEYIDIFGKGSTFKELSRDDLAAIPILEPTKNETVQMANFLDDKTSKIDDLIAKKERMIELLKEQRAAVINEAVTKGLDPNVKMKDSGVEWLGKVPEHWEVKRLKFMCDLINQSGLPDNDSVKIDLENIESWTGKINLEVEKKESEDKETKSFKKGDVLFNKLRPYLAKVYLAQEDGFCGGELLVLRPNEFISSKFLFYRVISEAFINVVNGSTYGSKMPRASWDFTGNLKTFFPDFNTQIAIINYLEKQIMQIEGSIITEEKSIEFLREYRTSLISEVVSGKIRIGG